MDRNMGVDSLASVQSHSLTSDTLALSNPNNYQPAYVRNKMGACGDPSTNWFKFDLVPSERHSILASPGPPFRRVIKLYQHYCLSGTISSFSPLVNAVFFSIKMLFFTATGGAMNSILGLCIFGHRFTSDWGQWFLWEVEETSSTPSTTWEDKPWPTSQAQKMSRPAKLPRELALWS